MHTIEGSWDEFNQRHILKLLKQRHTLPKHAYAIFDWDNTSIFGDIQEAVFAHQLRTLCFGMCPEQFAQVIALDVPQHTPFATPLLETPLLDQNEKPLCAYTLCQDLVRAYTALYTSHTHQSPLDPNSEDAQELIAKAFVLYKNIEHTFDARIAYPWISRMLTGLKPAQVQEMTRAAITWERLQPVGEYTVKSPNIPSSSGVVHAHIKTGLRMSPEVRSFYRSLQDCGIATWVCSASSLEVVRTFASSPEYGYRVPPDQVLAMHYALNKDGVFTPHFKAGYEQTQGVGKTRTIQAQIPQACDHGPCLVAGDSEGDIDMMTSFDDTRIALLFDRKNKNKDVVAFAQQALQTRHMRQHKHQNRIKLIQGRDEHTGLLIAQPRSITHT